VTIPVFDVALEVSKLKSPPANSANPAKVGGGLATLAGGTPRLEAVQPQPQISNFSNFSSPPPRIGQIEGASAPASETGLDWLPGPPGDADPAFNGWWAAYDLADVCHLYGVWIVRAGERILAVYPPELEPELIAYAGSLLAEARGYLSAHMAKLPALAPAEAVEIIKDTMRAHKSLRFCRGEAGSRWPLYPKTWTAGQRVTLQTLWFAAGDALDRDDFKGVDEI
jgi:hypothetical protein